MSSSADSGAARLRLRHRAGARSKPKAVYFAEVCLLIAGGLYAVVLAVGLPSAALDIFRGVGDPTAFANGLGFLLAVVFTLFVLARGLRRGKAWAWWGWVALCCLPLVFALRGGRPHWALVGWPLFWIGLSVFDSNLRAYLRGPPERT